MVAGLLVQLGSEAAQVLRIFAYFMGFSGSTFSGSLFVVEAVIGSGGSDDGCFVGEGVIGEVTVGHFAFEIFRYTRFEAKSHF